MKSHSHSSCLLSILTPRHSLLPLSHSDALHLLHSVATLLPLTPHSHATLLGLHSHMTLMYLLSLIDNKYLLMVIRDRHLVFASRTYTCLSRSVSLHLFILIYFHSFPFISVHPFIHSRSLYVFRSRTPTLSFSFPPDSRSTPWPLSTSCALALGHSVSLSSVIAT